MDDQTFVEKARAVHGDKYDYSLAHYYHDRSIRTTIICPDHGPFEQRPKNHLAGRGCNECSVEAQRVARKAAARNGIIERFKAVHGDRYDYSKVDYETNHNKVMVGCKEHGDFLIAPHNHLWGKGCRECYLESKLLTLEEFLGRAQLVHGDTYDYSMVEIVKSKEKVKIICPVHQEFLQNYSSHLQGKGCPHCAVKGYNSSKPGKLYVLDLGDVTKIGITNRNVNKRVNQIKVNSGKKFNIVTYFEFEDGNIPVKLESFLLRELRSIYEQPSEKYDGSTECFVRVDVQALLDRIKQLALEFTQ